MKRNHYARKKRQLKALAKKLNFLLQQETIKSSVEIERIVFKIRLLVKDLSSVFSKVDFKRVLGVAAVSLGVFYSIETSAQSFEPPVENPYGLTSIDGNGYALPAFADLDGDGDMDLLVGAYYGTMEYFENTGTSVSPQFASPVDNPFGLTSTYNFAAPALADLDGDGDLDVLVGELYGVMQFFENIGSSSNPQFASPVANPFGLTSTSVVAIPEFADMDGDGDMDLLVGELSGALNYYENTGSASTPSFVAPVTNPFGLTSTYYYSCPSVADIDNDGDLDVIVGEYEGVLQYFENTGNSTSPQFSAPVEDPFGLQSVYLAAFTAVTDLDDDGDIDLMVGGDYGAMHYFKNTLTTGISEIPNKMSLNVFPNPVEDLLFMDTEEQIAHIEIFNMLGQSMLILKKPSIQVDVSELNIGLYTLKVSYSSGVQSVNKFQKL